MTVTVLTPTFNRGGVLRSLWDSLQKQTVKDFEWLVVDDGSTDGTKNLITQLQENSDFPIRYIYKSNGGKHTALNVGIQTICSELTFIVDSDDCVTDDAVESILKIHKKYRLQNNICGYAFLRAFPDGKVNGKKFDVDERIGSYIDVRVNGDDTSSDKAEVFKTHCLKEFPFPEYPNEKFLGEDLVWVRMARKYQMVHINKAIYIGNYLEDGLTNNRRKHNIASPVGCMHRAEEFMESDLKTRYRIKGGLQYIVYGRFAGVKVVDLIRKSRHKILATVCIPGGLLLYARWNKAQ
ncbi:glycosyltransferase family 2 protein [Lactimicrobium massiliense]|uniref:glycosyltransferase family 2 protein n=1 Tax=Lactimicrobium massiliense TaxID=2161814 RepID=UPI000D555830|nr:glycosyltransferase family 2 protein [Lactimicrobium massiliense]